MKNIFTSAGTSLVIASLLLFGSCSEIQEEKVIATTTEKVAANAVTEEAYPGETGIQKTGKLFGKDIIYSEINGEAVFEGDIILSEKQLKGDENARTDGAGLAYNGQRWPDGIVYYTIDKSVINTSPIYAAISAVHTSTSVKFVPRTNQYSYVTFKIGRGFSSSIGIVGGQQFINLGIAYKMGSVLHEIGHTLGLFHEHTRLDRDNTIKINYANIAPTLHSYFQTYQASGYSGFDYDVMDLNSIMMLDSYSYSNNGQPTMTKLDGSTFETQRMYLSSKDLSAINTMYANMYAIRFTSLYAADNKVGKQALLSGTWTGTQAVTADPYFVYAAKNGSLLRINPLTGATTTIANNFNKVQAMVLLKGFLYVINDGYMVKVNTSTGASQTIGQRLWLLANSLAYMDGFFYIMTSNAIFSLVPDKETFTNVAATAEASELVAMDGHLYYISNSASFGKGIYKVRPFYTNPWRINSTSRSTQAQMTAYQGNLYLADAGYLYKIGVGGTETNITWGWQDTRQFTALLPYNY